MDMKGPVLIAWILTAFCVGALPDLNVVFFLVDDLGIRDLSCYGSDFHETPNIDRLAREGVRFTNAYARIRSADRRVQLS
jgi:hypothetical protein